MMTHDDSPTEATAADASSAFEASLPTTSGRILARLDELGIAYELHNHIPLNTVEESKKHTGHLPGAHIKNLYLRDNKKKNFLVVAEEDAAIDMKSLAASLGCGRLSFGSSERLMEFLGVRPGAVSPLALFNDDARRVRLALDRKILADDRINLHPLVNDKTVTISIADLEKFLTATGHWAEHLEIG